MNRKTFFQSLAGVFSALFLLSPEETPAQERREERREGKKKKGTKATGVGTCQSCTSYTVVNSTSGVCQRYPKVFTVSGVNAWQFPTMQATDGCGEFNQGPTS